MNLLATLDGDHKVQLRAEIKRLQKEKGLTSILVTHDQTEAIAMADLVAVMNQGVLNQLGELRVTQLVDGNKGIHAMMAKHLLSR